MRPTESKRPESPPIASARAMRRALIVLGLLIPLSGTPASANIPVGWACPPRQPTPMRDAAAFGFSVLLIRWAASHRETFGGPLRD